jgi:hypothetical protein
MKTSVQHHFDLPEKHRRKVGTHFVLCLYSLRIVTVGWSEDLDKTL